MDVLKVTSTYLFILGLGVPKHFKNKALMLFTSTLMAVAFFYIGFGYEILNFIVNGNIRILSVGFVCFNLTAFFAGVWISCMVHEVVMSFRSL
ncbi:hypothetical protein EHEL_040075 [Encephalitozoon hellem ATCC 50504]|uniref:Uncharacterized protein n=1 Tax=Encephalitozoon hellem TaxID=27973 RepID=A0A9Q9C9G7_ENCHE|nr:uncharacterized protein EHEL_040075 [Encephalitozoon hellem ATCC 50504]AHL28917.1 hypothetical protein EHEL_040075 [Encephalitozoon hellem ATCC 50504]UTX42902.1 hypothetical protein GPU96_04g06300 [Encephalitozoon hellem]